MASVLDYIECPNCKEEAHIDFYYKTGEEYTFCPNCGYTKEVIIKDKSKSLNELTNDDWEVIENKNPVGVYYAKQTGMVGATLGSFSTVLDMERMKNDVLENPEGIDTFIITRYIDGQLVKDFVINKIDKNENDI